MEIAQTIHKKRGPKKGTFRILTRIQRSKIEKLALEEGVSLNKISSETGGITREGVRYYLKRIDKHTEWKQRREAIKELEREKNELELSTKTSLLNVLVSGMFLMSNNRQLNLTLNYFFNNPYAKHRFDRVKFLEINNLLSLYSYAKETNLPVSLDTLAASSDINILKVSKVLSELGLETLANQRFSEEDEKTVRRIFLLEMSTRDLAYFWRKSRDNLIYHFRKIRDEIGYKRPRYYPVPSKRLESMVYESQDAGFNFGEICELLDQPSRLVEKSIERRESDSKEIMYALDVIYLGERHDKPYLHKISK